MGLQGGFPKSFFSSRRRGLPIAGSGVSGSPAGQALVEYVLLIAVALMFSLGILSSSRKFLRTAIQGFNVTLEDEIETCNLKEENIWNN